MCEDLLLAKLDRGVIPEGICLVLRPKGNAVFWRKKFTANKARDRLVTRTLRRGGWRVLRIWEHELRWISIRRTRVRLTLHSARGGAASEARLVARLRRALSP